MGGFSTLGGGIKKLSDLIIDADKDWQNYEIQNVFLKIGYKLSDKIYYADDKEVSTTSTSYVKVKEVQILNESWVPTNLTLRIYFEIHGFASSDSSCCDIRINGTSVYTTCTSQYADYYQSRTVDLTGINPGDLIEVYLKTTNEYHTAKLRNFRILGDGIENIVKTLI